LANVVLISSERSRHAKVGGWKDEKLPHRARVQHYISRGSATLGATSKCPRAHLPPQVPQHNTTLSVTRYSRTQGFSRAIIYISVKLTIPTHCHVSPSSVSRPSLRPSQSSLTPYRDLVMCRKQAGISIGRLCDKCDGKCPVCDSYVRPTTLARICDECSFGNYQNKCVVCGGEGISDAFYCFECTRLEKDRDGCPKIINLGSSRTDLFYQKKNFRNH
jgi:PHD finger-like domain-containing protein 5A